MNHFDDKSLIGIPETPHYYLDTFGVFPVEQRKVYAKRLLSYIVDLYESDDNSI